jgi:hypothetical protein
MSSKQLFFFSDPKDLALVLEPIEFNENIKYCETGLLDSSLVREYLSLFEIPNIGYVTVGDWNHCKSYLAYGKNDIIQVRDVPQRTGEIKYAVDQKLNPRSVVVKPGGILTDGVLIAGSIGTISNEPFSVNLFKLFAKLIKKNFSKVGAFYVSPIAKKHLENGWRLVTNDKSPKEYDLKLE